MGITNLDYQGLPRGKVREASGWPNVVESVKPKPVEEPAKRGPGRPPKAPEVAVEAEA